MAVHEARDHAAPAGVDAARRRPRRRARWRPRARPRSRARRRARGRAAPRRARLAGDEQPDVVDDERAHADAPATVTRLVRARAATSMLVCAPSRTISRPPTITCRTSAAPAAKTTASSACSRLPAGQPHAVERDRHEVGARARLDPPGLRPAEAGVAVRRSRRAAAPSAPWWPRSPLARRSSSSTARASSNRSITACESLPSDSDAPASRERAHPADAVGEVALGRRAEAAARARAAEQAHVGVVEVGGVHRGEARRQRAGVGEQRRRRAPVGGEARLVLGRLLGHVGVQRPVALGGPRRDRPPPPRGRRRARCGSRRRCGRRRSSSSASTRSAHASALPSEKRRCAPSGWRPDPAVQVAGVEQRDPDAGLARPRRSAPGPSRSGRRRACRRAVVEVVELADARDAGQRHLGERRAREREVALGVEPLGQLRTSARARSRTSRVRAGCARAARAGTRGCGRWRGRAASGREPPASARRRRLAARRPPRSGRRRPRSPRRPRAARRPARPARTSSVGHEPTRSTSLRARSTNASRWKRSNCSHVVNVAGRSTRSRNSTPSRWSNSCWNVPGGQAAPDLVVLDAVAVEVAHAGRSRGAAPRRAGSGTDRQPSLISTISSSSGSITGLTITVSGIGGLYG